MEAFLGTPTHPTALEAVGSIQAIEARIAPLRARLTTHPLYTAIRTSAHLRTFMESHVFAVWDFMSLLKSLQARLTCVDIPWVPSPFPESRRFINEIVLGEESDQFNGRAISHFELYLEAMTESGADTASIRSLLAQLTRHPGTFDPTTVQAPAAARDFVTATFDIIQRGSLAAIAAAFTFGREDVIPDIFRELVRDLHRRGNNLGKFIWYLERHIEVDGEDHGPLSLRMVADLCGDDETLWEESTSAAESAIAARLALWDGILANINTNHP
jgi:hypothetical protein